MENLTKNPVGRPKKTLNDLPDNWEQEILKLKSEGGSDVECMAMLDISKEVWARFLEEEPEFTETIKRGQILCETWWLNVGRTGIYHSSGGKQIHTNVNPAMWFINMKNRFGWRDKQDIEAKVTNTFEIIIKE
jgi:hypothetical protein